MMKTGGFEILAVSVIFATMGVQKTNAQTVSANLFKNPGFESAADWWNFDQSFGADTGTIVYTDPRSVHSGAKGAKIEITAVDGSNWHIQLQCPPQFDAVKDNIYHLNFWARTNSPDGKTVHVAVQDGAPNYAYRSGQDFRLDTAWQQVQKDWTSDVAGTEALRFNLYLGADTGTFYFDDFSLTTEAGPASAVRHPVRTHGASSLNHLPIPGVDAAGRSGQRGNARIRFH